MRYVRRLAAIGTLALAVMLAFGANPSSAAAPRAHVYLLRGLMNIFSLGMDTLADELQKHGIYATVSNHSEWQTLADQAAAGYKAGTEGPIILIGHSLGADAVMEMAAYLDRKGVPVALLVPFDGTQSFPTPKNVARLLNVTQRDYAYMRAGPGFHGSLTNLDVSGDPNIGHTTIDKTPRLHARVIAEVLAVVGGGRRAPTTTATTTTKPTVAGRPGEGASPAPANESKPEAAPEPAKPAGGGVMNAAGHKSAADSAAPAVAAPERPVVSAPAHKPPVDFAHATPD
jgi:alpha-beta hydrolase superfamily lysophospholipase